MSKYDISINGHRYEIEVTLRKNSGDAAVSATGAEYEVKVGEAGSFAASAAQAAARSAESSVSSSPASPAAQAQASPADQVPQTSAPAAQPAAPSSGRPVTAPLPGVILQICVNEGQQVRRGQKMAVLEAMKMENDILADADGIVESILVQKGDSVLEDATIMTIQQ